MAEIPSALFHNTMLSRNPSAGNLQDRRGLSSRFSHDSLSRGLGTTLSAQEIRIGIKSPPSPARDPPLLISGLSIPLLSKPLIVPHEFCDLLFLEIPLHRLLAAVQLLEPSKFAPEPMDSAGSSTNPQTAEERLADIQQSLDALKLKTDVQQSSINSNAAEVRNQWNTFAFELQTLKNDLQDSKGEVNYYKDVIFTHFKDATNVTGNFGNRIIALESVVRKIMEKFK